MLANVQRQRRNAAIVMKTAETADRSDELNVRCVRVHQTS